MTAALRRARAISRLIDEEALASERPGRFTDRVAAALLEANLCSIGVPQAGDAVNTFVHKGAPPKACQEVFGNGPVACWATLLPKATSVEEQDGFCVSGSFSWGSSSSFSRRVMVPAG
jgi:hypothetical protein